jgi:translation initiation factor IF-3
VEVAPQANPPVCRIMDYGKFKFDAAQRAKESRRRSSNVSIKEMKYRPKIGPGDFETKTRQVSRFLGDGHKVKVTIMFRGREVFHPELGRKILDRIAEEVSTVGKVEASARLDGRNMTMVLAPDKRAQQLAARAAEEQDGKAGDGAVAVVPLASDSQTPVPPPVGAGPVGNGAVPSHTAPGRSGEAGGSVPGAAEGAATATDGAPMPRTG